MSKHYFDPRLRIFALSSNRPLAEEVAVAVDVELGKSPVARFNDRETQVNIRENTHGPHVYIVQSTSSPVNDNLVELLVMTDALKRASAKTINVVVPYYGYTRQDRKARAREPIIAKLVANMIQKANATRMLTLDLHAIQVQGFFSILVDHLMSAPLIVNYFLGKEIRGDNVVIVSPNHGGVTRARKLAEFLKPPITIIDRCRPKANVTEVMDIAEQVKGKTCIPIDDMIDTASMITLAANALKETGATGVYASCIHPVLPGPALQRIEDSVIECLVVTDSIYLPEDRKIDKIDEVSVGGLMGDTIKRIHESKPVSPLLETENK